MYGLGYDSVVMLIRDRFSMSTLRTNLATLSRWVCHDRYNSREMEANKPKPPLPTII